MLSHLLWESGVSSCSRVPHTTRQSQSLGVQPPGLILLYRLVRPLKRNSPCMLTGRLSPAHAGSQCPYDALRFDEVQIARTKPTMQAGGITHRSTLGGRARPTSRLNALRVRAGLERNQLETVSVLSASTGERVPLLSLWQVGHKKQPCGHPHTGHMGHMGHILATRGADIHHPHLCALGMTLLRVSLRRQPRAPRWWCPSLRTLQT